MSSCSLSSYHLHKERLNVPKQNVYKVRYEVDLAVGLTAKISYKDTDETVKIEEIKGQWAQTVTLKTVIRANLKLDVKGIQGKGELKVFVEDKVVSKYTLSDKILQCKVNLALP